MANSRPGIYINEVSLPQSLSIVDSSASVATFLGATAKGPVGPTLVSSWRDFVKTFGGQDAVYRMPTALYHFFSNGGGSAYIVRMLGTTSATATATISDTATPAVASLTASAINPGTWANSNLSIAITAGAGTFFDLHVYQTVNGTSVLAESFRDLNLNASTPFYAVAVVNAGSKLITLARHSAGGITPKVTTTNIALTGGASAIDTAALTGTIDGVLSDDDYNHATTGAVRLLDIVNSPLVINFPDAAYYPVASLTTYQGICNGLMSYCETRTDSFAVIDPLAGRTVTEAIANSAAIKSTATGANSATYYPWLVVPDTVRGIPGATVTIPPGPAMVGQIIATDRIGPFKAPAGLTNRLANVVAVERKLTNDELDSLNTAAVPVNVIRNVPGAGIVAMGARTMRNYPGDRYINVRRSMIYIKKELENLTSFALFENNDYRLWDRVNTVVGTFLLNYWADGGLRGRTPRSAFYVKCDSTINTETDIFNGTVNIEVGVALEYPAEFVVINIGQITGSATA
jgi:phage tail sheath protein FI